VGQSLRKSSPEGEFFRRRIACFHGLTFDPLGRVVGSVEIGPKWPYRRIARNHELSQLRAASSRLLTWAVYIIAVPDVLKPGTFSANCLLAPRPAERDMRFVQLYHCDWDHYGGMLEPLPMGVRRLRGYNLAYILLLLATTYQAVGDSTMKYFLFGAAALHASFMAAELLPWPRPLLLKKASENLRPIADLTKDELPPEAKFTDEQLKLIATIVHNAGIYNGIVAGGLLWAAIHENDGHHVARVMLLGATAAGIFGTMTLKSWPTAFQGLVGLVGLFLVGPKTCLWDETRKRPGGAAGA
jgi:Protein of unknown function (DUF1304)/Protein of unknown function (DUF1501)